MEQPVRRSDPTRIILCFCLYVLLASCDVANQKPQTAGSVPLQIPRGYVSVLEVVREGRLIKFGPFVGYYFTPSDPNDLSRLDFVCLNERSFYTIDIPENKILFKGVAVLSELPDTGNPLPGGRERISPVFFEKAPPSWLATRPEPAAEFVHFHSCYDANGPVRFGYWLRHEAVADFTYDMGGRVGPASPLFHEAKKGVDREFARIIEFDRGPDK